MTTPQQLADLLGLESTDSPSLPTFPDLLEKLYQARYQGALTLHFTGGVARAVVLQGEALKLPLDTGQTTGA